MDIKSFCFGLIAAVVLAVVISAGPTSDQRRYQMFAVDKNMFAFDATNGRVYLIYKQRTDTKPFEQWPWKVDSSFSLEDALHNPQGATPTIP